MSLWDSYVRYFREFQPILRDMSRRGLPVSEAHRVELEKEVDGIQLEVDEKVRAIVPVEVLGKKQKNGYKRPPILECEECGYKGRGDHICISANEEDGVQQNTVISYSHLAELQGLVMREVVIEEEEKCLCVKKERSACGVCAGSGIIPAGVVVTRWAELVEFNPNSSQQVKRYMKYRKHPIPKHAKRTDANGEASDTTEVKELERLFAKTKDPIYPLLIQKRQLTKVKGTYVEGWKPEKDGRVRTTFTFAPATWQTSSKSPNIQNGLKHGKDEFQKRLAKKFAAMQRAEPGHLMMNFDFKSFHAQTTACEFGLPDYLRLSKIDIHSFVTCHYLKLPERVGLLERPDEEMKEIFKRLKQGEKFKFTRDYKEKRTILGIQFAMFWRKLYQLNRDDFQGEKEAKELWELIMVQLFPGLKRGQDKMRQMAQEQGFLQNKYGAIRRFYDVQRWSAKDQKFVGGDDAEAAVAFLPASSAFGHVRDVLRRIRAYGWDDRYQLVNSIHDSLVFHCPRGLVEECAFNITREMSLPSEILKYPICPEGLSVEAEASVGESLEKMEEIKVQ